MFLNSHSYSILEKRWTALAKRKAWRLTELHQESDYHVLAFENEAATKSLSGGCYLSAGVHGDECAPVWGLLEWAEALDSSERVAEKPLVICPCLNPYGLVENSRLDSKGVDLNRNFQNSDHLLIKAWQHFLRGRRFEIALNLHEDYDAGGIYLYELNRNESIGDALLAACEEILPRETANEIDGSEMVNGLLERTGNIEQIAEEDLGGWPESIWLHLKHATDAFTFETPSERDLSLRIETHRRFIDAALSAKLR